MALRLPDDLAKELAQLGIEARFHDLLAELCGGERDYLRDITLDDLSGRCDSNGSPIPAPVARGLIRKLEPTQVTSTDAKAADSTGPAGTVDGTAGAPLDLRAQGAVPDASSVGTCSVAMRRGDGDYASLVRCTVRGQMSANDSGARRRKVLTAVLDNSGSMRNEWPLVVDAISRVFTDELLSDHLVSLNAVVYNTKASEVVIPSRASELPDLLREQFAPGGITNFQSAFELSERIIRREVGKFLDAGVRPSAIDVTTLLFTDGEDTSAPPQGTRSANATAKARAAGDAFRRFLRTLGCPAHTCIAAFGQQHNPEQCQYLSDRYYYINRKEVLSEWLTGGLAELLQSAGHCSLHLRLPRGLELAEPLPTSIGLAEDGQLDKEIWLRADSGRPDCPDVDTVIVDVEDSGSIVLRGSAAVDSAAVVSSESLEGRLFLLDAGELQLRQIALELRGRRPSAVELVRLQERLVGVKELVQPVMDVAAKATARLSGRALLRARLEELETRRNRLSYALGHFDDQSLDVRNIGGVGIDAILRDASQHVPLGATAMARARRAEQAAALPAPEPLSSYGRECTFDALSGCDAEAAAQQGDAMFFRLHDVSLTANGCLASAKDCGSELVAYETFMLLSSDGSKPVRPAGDEQGFTHLGLPLYATAGHFLRAKLLLPEALRRLSPNGAQTTEKLLLNLLGHALASHLDLAQKGSALDIALLHKARSVHALLDAAEPPAGGKSIDEVIAEADLFVAEPGVRRGKDLYEMAAVGFIAQGWSPERIEELGDAVISEAARRMLARELEGKSETERLHLAWTILGPSSDGDAWLDEPLDGSIRHPRADGFDILVASTELEELHKVTPGEYAPRDARLLPELLGSQPPPGTPPTAHWSSLRKLLSQWSALVAVEGGLAGVWRRLDDLMVGRGASHEEILPQLTAVMQLGPPCKGLRDVLAADPRPMLRAIAIQCMGNAPGTVEQPPRLAVAGALRAVVSRREAIARKYPITNVGYPSPHRISRGRMQQMWGAPAAPVDEELHAKVRREVHQRHCTLPLVLKEALSDKEYRQRGGHFAFPTHLDTFVPGLHRRTRDLHEQWKKEGGTSGPELRASAVEELLLRLRWDDRDQQARSKLSKILSWIWDGLEGLASEGKPPSSALWIDDDAEASEEGKDGDAAVGGSTSSQFTPPARGVQNDPGTGSASDTGEDDWKVV